MAPITLIIIIMLVGAYFTLRRRDFGPPVGPRPALPTRGIQVICGDCSGHESIPRKTLMDRIGHCAQCGGSNLMNAMVGEIEA